MRNLTQPIEVEPTIHRGEKRLKLIFKYDKDLIAKIREIDGCRWSATMRCWHVPDSEISRRKMNSLDISYSLDNFHSLDIPNEKEIEIETFFFEVELMINYHENKIYIAMPYDEVFRDKIKAIQGSWYHPGAKVWSINYNSANERLLRRIFSETGCKLTVSETKTSYFEKQIHKNAVLTNHIPSEYINQLRLENKSIRTIEIYCSYINKFLDHFKETEAKNISNEKIREYILDHRINKGYSESYQNQMVSSLRSFYRNQYKREFEDGILPRPKKSKYLPKVIPREDIQRMINVCKNEKHKMIILLLYGFGLRLNELICLRISHINLERRQLMVVKGKGKKDRVLPIPRIVADDIRKYIKSYLPKDFFISGQGGSESYSNTSVQNVVKNLAKKAGIKSRVTPHILRHCYATHML